MAKVREVQVEAKRSNPEKRDILTEMFEHFGIEVIDVPAQNIKPNKEKKIRQNYEKG